MQKNNGDLRDKELRFYHCIKALTQHKQMTGSAADVRKIHHPATKENERKRMRRGLPEISGGFLCLSLSASLTPFRLPLKFWADRNTKAFDTLLKTPHPLSLSKESPVSSLTHYQELWRDLEWDRKKSSDSHYRSVVLFYFYFNNFQIKLCERQNIMNACVKLLVHVHMVNKVYLKKTFW